MRTPYGKECTFYYEDYGRGHQLQECRLLGPGGGWKSPLCKGCPVPGIQMANACPDMTLRGSISRGLFGLGRRMKVTVYCRRSNRSDFDPHIGCPECHKEIRGIRSPKER